MSVTQTPAAALGTDADSNIRMTDVSSSMSPDAVLPLMRSTIDQQTTIDINLGNYRQGKFTNAVANTKFDDLQKVDLPDGDSVWSAVQTIDGIDYSFYLKKSDIMSTINLQEVQSEAQAEAVAKEYGIEVGQTYITINGKKYFVNMAVPMHFGTGDTPSLWVQAGLFVLGDGALGVAIAAAVKVFGLDAFKNAAKELGVAAFKVIWALLRGMVTGAYRFMFTIATGLILRADLNTTVRAAGEAAGEAWTKAVEKITVRRVAYAFAGVFVMIGVTLFLEYVLHRSYQHIYIYNLTAYDIAFSFPYSDEGELGNSATNIIRAKGAKFGPGDVPLGYWYNGAAFSYQSASDWHGLGFVLKLNLQKKDGPEIIKTFTCMFDIPYSGENSLAATVDPIENYQDFYQKNTGAHRVTQLSAYDKEQEIIVTYDYLRGKHEDPQTGQELFLYSSMVIVRDRIASA